tara:strand:- start:126 stop:602 length:477 start_codon:yes stop_codon:yes gene_type:complete
MQYKKYTKQRSRSIQGLRSFKDTLPIKIKKIINKKGSIYPEILNNWTYMVDKDLFDICYPNKFKSSNSFRGSTLEVMVNRGCEVDVEYSKKKIINKINSFFGYIAVERLKIIAFEKNRKNNLEKIKIGSKKDFSKSLKNIKNMNLKNALIDLIKSYKR